MPQPPNSHLAQYNEAAIAGSLWGVTAQLGGGDRTAGMVELLQALKLKPAQSMRDARDAIAEDSSIEQDRDDHERISEVLRKQRISWEIEVHTGYHGGSHQGNKEFQVKLTGADTCQVMDESAADHGLLPPDFVAYEFWLLAGEGGLAHTWHDDCFGWSDGDATYGNLGPDLFFVDLPHTGSSDPAADDLTVSVRYTCFHSGTPDQCSSSINADTLLYHGEDRTPSSPSGTGAAKFHEFTVNFPRNTWVPIATFDGQGECTVTSDSFDCGV
jgi:hypothetical protein